MDIKNFAKGLTNSLKILDNQYVYCIIVVILFLYNSLLFININDFFSNIYKFGIVRVIVLLLILYTSQKSYLISLLLAMSYILSIYFDREKVHNTENFFNNEEESAPKGINDMINSNNALTYDSEKINQNKMMNDQNMINTSNKIESFEDDGRGGGRGGGGRGGGGYAGGGYAGGGHKDDNGDKDDGRRHEDKGGERVRERFEDDGRGRGGGRGGGGGGAIHRREDDGDNDDQERFVAHGEEHMLHGEEQHMMKHQNVMESMSNMNEKNMMNNTLTETECLQNYKPKFDSVGNVCSPVATFNDEFNAQGLNYPIGYNVK